MHQKSSDTSATGVAAYPSVSGTHVLVHPDTGALIAPADV